jgi:predicted DNA-binding transcriptional regulator YafY
VERLLNVIMTIGARRSIDRERLFHAIPEYEGAESPVAAEKMFERDKAAILDLGLPLISERDPWDESRVTYRIDAAERTDTLDLTPEEYTVLLAASRAWDDAAAGGAARRVRAKLLTLGVDADPDLLRRTPRGAVESLPVLAPLLEAVTGAGRVRFDYRTADGRLRNRTVEPWVVGVYAGHWYVLGHDVEREEQRVFRASRIESFPRRAGKARAPRPEHVDLAARLEPGGDETDEVRLRIAPYKALHIRDELGVDLAQEELEPGRMTRAGARRLVLSDARWIELVEPAPWRQEVGEVLAAVAAAHEGPADLEAVRTAPVRTTPEIRPSATSTDHLSRLISEAAFVLDRGEVEIEEVAAEFGIGTEQLVQDLQVLFLCGDMGTGWEQDLIETEWESGVVRVRNAETLHRPLRLTAAEATALLGGLVAVDPAGGREREIVDSARSKLVAHLAGSDVSAEAEPSHRSVAPGVGAGAAPQHRSRQDRVVDAVQDAITDHGPLWIHYSPPDRPGTSVRRLRPLRIETVGERRYLVADLTEHDITPGPDHDERRRRFRIDRIVEVGPDTGTDGSDPSHEEAGHESPAPAGRVDGEVWLRLEGPALWVAEAFEARELRDHPGGVTFARIEHPVRAALSDAVSEAAGSAQVLSPATLREDIVTVSRHGAARHGVPGPVG